MEQVKYSVEEIDTMRRLVESLWYSRQGGACYYEKDKTLQVEQQLRTYMQNGTTISDLQDAAGSAARARQESDEAQRKFHAAMREGAEKAKAERNERLAHLSPTERILQDWFDDCVAKYDGAATTSDALYDGLSGKTLKRFANQQKFDGAISQKDMERFLESQGVRSRTHWLKKTYDGVAVVISGSVSSMNYST